MKEKFSISDAFKSLSLTKNKEELKEEKFDIRDDKDLKKATDLINANEKAEKEQQLNIDADNKETLKDLYNDKEDNKEDLDKDSLDNLEEPEESTEDGEYDENQLPNTNNNFKIEDLEFNENYFNILINKYLKENYLNVANFSTTRCGLDVKNNIMSVNGIIKFNDNKVNTTKFIFEQIDNLIEKNKDNISFKGFNKTFSPCNDSFILQSKIIDNNLICEKLLYNYNVKNDKLQESIKVVGKVSLKD